MEGEGRRSYAGRIVRAREIAPEFSLSADVVVVGTGAGGSMVVRDLARAGLRVVAVEMGSSLRAEQMTQREDEMLPRLFAEAGSRATEDGSIRVMQGRGVGGSTLHNTNLCKSVPQVIRDEWSSELGVELPGFDDDVGVIEQLLGVKRITDDRVNRNNAILRAGREALGYAGGRLRHNRDDQCQQSGFCELGCAYDGKLNAARVLVPAALEAGATILTEARVDHVVHDGVQVQGVRGELTEVDAARSIGTFHIAARAVVLAGSATASGALHRASAIPDPYGHAGEHLHLHPGAMVVGFHDEEVRGWEGNPQSEECTELLEHGPSAEHRAWIVSAFAHPAVAATILPGFGPAHGRVMKEFARTSCVVTMLHDRSEGRIHGMVGEHVRLSYELDRDDRAQLALGLRTAARILLAGGAREVMIPLRPVLTASTEAELAAITPESVGPFRPSLIAVHPMSTLRMSARPEDGVVDAEGRHHHVRGLYVADGSLYPSSIGGPPQIGIYTLGRRVARTMAADLT